MPYDTLIDDPIKVWAFFDPSTGSGQAGIFPIAMDWNRRFIKFEKVIFTSSKRVGQTRFVDLVCASETSNFELEYNANDYSWRLKKVMPKDT